MSTLAGVAVRVAAARVLDGVLHRGRSLKAELPRAQAQLHDPRDRALLEATCLAVLRRRADYQAALAGWLARPLPAREGAVQAL
ncbi:MAG: 16S rRNA (cytosine(967)-C(5))-methyltransferase, partial [Pseudoxanthomonas sp.]